MSKKIKYFIWRVFKYFGYEILPDERKNSIQSYLLYLIKTKNVDFVLDVGSNFGQFYYLIRNIGYEGEIVLFEPLLECQNALQSITKHDQNVSLHPYALGSSEEKLTFYVTKNNVSSSLLLPLKSEKIYTNYEVNVKKLDSLNIDISSRKCVLLKIDAQGYEKNVLLGSIETLKSINYILLELSITAQYVGEVEMLEMFKFMQDLDFKPIFIYPGVANHFNEMLQYEVVFKRVY